MKSTKDYTQANRDAWNEVAPRHHQSNQANLIENFKQPGFNGLDEHSIAPLKHFGVQGKSVAQVCCNNGLGLLSIKNMGASRCVGFDMSAEFLKQAAELKEAANHGDVDFYETDAYDIPSIHADTYDWVVITIGVLSWMPDLKGFFKVIDHLLKPGGHLFIEETHPVLFMYEDGEGDQSSYLAYSYFNKEVYVETTGLDYFSHETYEAKPAYSFQYTLSDVLSAAIEIGLDLNYFEELDYDISCFCMDLEHAEIKPPMGMVGVWKKAE